jgi:hypothetical protein
MFLRPFGLYRNACFGILVHLTEVINMLCGRSLWFVTQPGTTTYISITAESFGWLTVCRKVVSVYVACCNLEEHDGPQVVGFLSF